MTNGELAPPASASDDVTSPHRESGPRREPRPPSLLRVEALSKTFAGGKALDGFALTVGHGEVHALVGQNGCGKSTFIKILSGYHRADHGYLAQFEGQELRLGDPDSTGGLGIHFVHQDLGLLDDLSATENLAIGSGYKTGRMGRIRWKEQTRRARTAIESLGYDFDVDLPVGLLSPSERVGVAIARALTTFDERITLLVLDEPTASLPQAEVDNLFAVLRRLRAAGTSVLFVSHRLDEVLDIADQVTVVRDGRRVATTPVTELDHATLVGQILGRTLTISHETTQAAERSAPSMIVRGLRGHHLHGLDLDLYPGEILGVAGLTGSGREELAPLLFGAEHRAGGSIVIDGVNIERHSPFDAKRQRMALVPANRRSSAVIPDATVRENLSLASLSALCRGPHINGQAERADVENWLTTLNVKPRDGEVSILSLSGGNQQKVLLARWLRLKPRILLLDEPTQGVDVGTKPEIYGLLRQDAHSGPAVVVCSTDTEELVEVCDRVVVLARGRQRTELSREALTLDRVNHEILAG
jgi:ribose transport system ATP-binding protein